MAKINQSSSAVLRGTALLITESKADFDRIRGALHEGIKPRGILEQIYVEDIVYQTWEAFPPVGGTLLHINRCNLSSAVRLFVPNHFRIHNRGNTDCRTVDLLGPLISRPPSRGCADGAR
jgi:hypothetical protein